MDGSDLVVARAAHVSSRGLPLELLIHALNWSFPFTQFWRNKPGRGRTFKIPPASSQSAIVTPKQHVWRGWFAGW